MHKVFKNKVQGCSTPLRKSTVSCDVEIVRGRVWRWNVENLNFELYNIRSSERKLWHEKGDISYIGTLAFVVQFPCRIQPWNITFRIQLVSYTFAWRLGLDQFLRSVKLNNNYLQHFILKLQLFEKKNFLWTDFLKLPIYTMYFITEILDKGSLWGASRVTVKYNLISSLFQFSSLSWGKEVNPST